MTMQRKPQTHQESFWVTTSELPESPGHPFYARLEQVLIEGGFDMFVEAECEPYYADRQGRPSIPPGVYFRMLLIGYFERIDSERGIAWRCEDSLSLRNFLGIPLNEKTPDHSSLSRIRTRLPLETHDHVFSWVLKLLARQGLLDGKTLGVDATTLEANAALRSIVRRDTGESYRDFLTNLAKAEGIESPTRSDVAKVDRKRPRKGSNADWVNPHEPDAQITKMKDGSTHLAHKAEQVVDMSGNGVVVAVQLYGGAAGDTDTGLSTLAEAHEQLGEIKADRESKDTLNEEAGKEIVADKGYHSNDMLVAMAQAEIRTYISEPERGRRCWEENPEAQEPVYANRRRMKRDRGKGLSRLRGELLERPFAHYLEGGGLRRTHLRGHDNILKRLLVHVAGFNLGLLMRALIGVGTPKGFGALPEALNARGSLVEALRHTVLAVFHHLRIDNLLELLRKSREAIALVTMKNATISTGC